MLEELYQRQAEEITVQLARHYAEAGMSEKAVDYLLQAGDRARALYAYHEAIDHYQRALAFLKQERSYERAARVLMKLGLTYHIAFDFCHARQAYEEGFTLWQRAGELQPVTLPPAPHALRVSWSDPPTLDPTMAADTLSICVIDQLFRGLVELSPELDVVPAVARTWDVLEGGQTYVFHLRGDARWSDGAPVTAGDFEYAWKRVLAPARRSPCAGLLYDVKGAMAFHRGELSDPGQVGVQAAGPATLIVELEGPTSYFPYLLAHNATYPVPRHVVETCGEAWTAIENIVTNGPFRLESWQRGQSMVLSRNPEYRSQFTGNVERLEMRLQVDRSAGLELYEADGLEVFDLWSLPPSERDRIRQHHSGEYVSVPGLATNYVGFDVSRPPFDDPRVRRAFVLAVDRETLADVVLRGYVFPATGGFVPPGMPGHSAGIGLPYDPGQAQRLLAEAGYPGGVGFPSLEALVPLGSSLLNLLSEYLQAQWRANLGVEIVWKTLEWALFTERLRRESAQVFVTAWWADHSDPDNFLRASTMRAYTRWRHAVYEKLVEEARRVTDQGERMRLYGQADRILISEAAVIPLIHERLHLLVKPWVCRFPTSAINWWFWKDVVIQAH